MKTMSMIFLVLASAASAVARTPGVTLASVHTIYVAPMANGLNTYLEASITKRLKGRVTLVSSRENADAVLSAAGSNNGKLAAALIGGAASLAVSLKAPDGTIIWADSEAGHSLWFPSGGKAERNAADHIAKALAKATER